MAVLGLRFCARAFSSCGKRGPLFIAVHGPHYRGLSCCGAQAPDVQAQQLWLTGPVAPRHVGSSQTRARIRVPCIGRQTLNHCATREVPEIYFCAWCGSSPVWFFSCSCLVFLAPLIEEAVFSPTIYSCLLCCRLIAHKSVGSFLGSLFCSVDLCVCLYASTILYWWL